MRLLFYSYALQYSKIARMSGYKFKFQYTNQNLALTVYSPNAANYDIQPQYHPHRVYIHEGFHTANHGIQLQYNHISIFTSQFYHLLLHIASSVLLISFMLC